MAALCALSVRVMIAVRRSGPLRGIGSTSPTSDLGASVLGEILGSGPHRRGACAAATSAQSDFFRYAALLDAAAFSR